MRVRSRAAVLVLLACAFARPGHAQQDPSAPLADEPQATFRSGVNVVRVDVIVSDRQGNPVTDLTREDFELFEDGKPQVVDQFRLVHVPGTAAGEALPATELRTRDDEMFDAEREDVRVFAMLLDEYHVPRDRSQAVRDMLTDFIRTHVGPNDLLTVMYPLTSVRTLTFTRDHDAVVRAIRQFEGRKGEYTPRNAVEEQHWRNLPQIGRIRTQVVADALSALSVRLGSLREGRKSLIFVSDGLPAGLLQLRDVARDANRHNVSIYPVDPCGLMVSLPSAGGFRRGDCSSNRMRTDGLRYLAEETDGRAIVNRNTLAEGLAQIGRDSSAYYLLGYTSSQSAADGKFHQVRVRVARRGVEVRARKGYFALTEADLAVVTSTAPIRLTPVQQALASIDAAADGKKYVRTWIGSARADGGETRVSVVWERLSRPGLTAPDLARLSFEAAGADGAMLFEGGGPIEAAPQRVTFTAPEGRVELRFAIEGEEADILDRDVVTLDVPGWSAAGGVSTPRVYAARTALEFRAMEEDADAVPIARREFYRIERLLLRFDAYDAAVANARVSATLLNRQGDRMADLPVAPAKAGGTHQISFGLGALAPGEYVIRITVAGPDGETSELVPLRVGG